MKTWRPDHLDERAILFGSAKLFNFVESTKDFPVNTSNIAEAAVISGILFF
jgi:hypothetical protein